MQSIENGIIDGTYGLAYNTMPSLANGLNSFYGFTASDYLTALSAANILGSGLEATGAVGLGKVAKDVGKAVIGKIGVNVSKVVNDITKESVYLKLNNYLLDPTHKAGASKAQWFEQALGFKKQI